MSRKKSGEEKKPLLIVESPTKAKTLAGYLGGEFRVLASKGHIKDLPKSQLGVDIDEGFKPKYIVIKGKAKVLRALKDAAKGAPLVLLGSDPDREGEAIAYHLAEELRKVTQAPIKRALFYEITPDEVRAAVASPQEIDMNKVLAQQARRILDRLVGYQVSPLLWKLIRGGLSAGRVQTVALRLLAEREREIEAFVPEKYWVLVARFRVDGQEVVAKLTDRIWDKAEAEALLGQLSGSEFVVEKFERKRRKVQPPPPYKTSTLQAEASSLLGFSAQRTMAVAQELYEGVELGDRRRGLITYMRTDSVRLADKAVAKMREVLGEIYGPDMVPPRPRRFKDKGRVQGAHEAIRPTDPSLVPDELMGLLREDLLKLYTLIWRRAMASQAQAAEVEGAQAILVPEGKELRFKAEGRVVVSPGFYRVLDRIPEDSPLPTLRAGQRLSPEKLELLERETEPPPRYTEASLVKTLEKLGIGRPSTYATIITTLLARGYVQRKGRALAATPLGVLVAELLVKHFPEVFNVKFTAEMEEGLDKVEEGSLGWQDLLRDFWEPFSRELREFESRLEEIKASLPEVPLYYKGQSRYSRRRRGRRRQ